MKRPRTHYCRARLCSRVVVSPKSFCKSHFEMLPQEMRTLRSADQVLAAIDWIAVKEHNDRLQAMMDAGSEQ